MHVLRAILVGLICLSLSACAAHQYVPLKRTDDATIRGKVKVGNEVRVIVKDGREFFFTVTALEERELYGRSQKQTFKISYSQIEAVEVREVDVFSSVVTSIGVAVAALYVASLIALAVVMHELEDQD